MEKMMTQPGTIDTEKMIRTSCAGCKFYKTCTMEPRRKMYKKNCYLSAVSEKTKIKPEKIIQLLDELADELGNNFSSNLVPIFSNLDWVQKTEQERKSMAEDFIKYWQTKRKKWDKAYIPDTSRKISEYCSLIVAIVNTCLGTWRNEQYVPCLRCGEIFENSKQHNRKFCEKCTGYQKRTSIERECIDCGESFFIHPPNNRQQRCDCCQADANKESARLRAKRYRERKNHGIA